MNPIKKFFSKKKEKKEKERIKRNKQWMKKYYGRLIDIYTAAEMLKIPVKEVADILEKRNKYTENDISQK